MASNIMRFLIGLVGIVSAFTALQHWFMLDSVAVTRGFSGLDIAGRANFRADVGGMFLAIGVSHLIAAWRQSATWALNSAAIIALALIGRIVSLALDGSGNGVWAPVIIEAVCLSLSLVAWQNWKGKVPEGL
jgi:hypothetical protein